MFSKLLAVCFIAVHGVTNVAASIPPGIYNIENVESHSLVRAYQKGGPLFVRSTRENPGPFALFDIQNSETSSGYTIKNVGLDEYVSAAADAPGAPLLANGKQEAFSVEQAGEGQFVIKLVNKDLVWTIEPPVVPFGNVILLPATGEETQHFILIRADDLRAHQTAPSSAKFRAKESGVENCGHKWSSFRPVEVVLQYLPYGRY